MNLNAKIIISLRSTCTTLYIGRQARSHPSKNVKRYRHHSYRNGRTTIPPQAACSCAQQKKSCRCRRTPTRCPTRRTRAATARTTRLCSSPSASAPPPSPSSSSSSANACAAVAAVAARGEPSCTWRPGRSSCRAPLTTATVG